MTPSELLVDLSPEEYQDVASFVEYSRELRAKGFRPVVGASKGQKTKLIRGGDCSILDFVDELIASDMFAATIECDLAFKAKLRGLKTRELMLSYQSLPWKSNLVAEYLKITPQMVSRKRRSGKLLGLSFGKKEYLYPSWQFAENNILTGLENVLSVLNSGLVPDWDKLRFLTTPDLRLEAKTPVEYLRSGQLDRVLTVAKVYGVQVA